MGRAFEYRKAAKMKRWGNMSRVFPRLGRMIMIAAKEGGGDPDMNPKLRAAILNAKAENMPKDNIDAAIKRALGKDAQTLTETTYEGKGPHGSLFFVECATDNNTRTVANIKSAFKKAGGEMLNNGSLDFMFTRKAVFEFAKTEGMDIEELELELSGENTAEQIIRPTGLLDPEVEILSSQNQVETLFDKIKDFF